MHTSAIIAALPSCRQVMVLSAARRVKRIENSEIAFARHVEHMVGAMGFELIDEYALGHERAPNNIGGCRRSPERPSRPETSRELSPADELESSGHGA